MKKNVIVLLIVSFFLGISFVSCKKEKINEASGSGQVEFSLSLNELKSALTSAQDSGIVTGISSIVITIEDLSGKVIINSEKVDLYSMNGSYISRPISLATGDYKLTKFLVIDWRNTIVYASPLKGSSKAYLVQKPLPIEFRVQTNVVTKLVPEVLTVNESSPEAFGYETFSFNVAKTFDFLIGAFVYNETIKNYELTTADISILSDTTVVYTGKLSANNDSPALSLFYDSVGITNKITLPERYNNYKLIITKQGYKTCSRIFTKEELKQYFRSIDNGPLVIILEMKDAQIPTLTTMISNIALTTATSGGNITFDGGSVITAKGVCWSTNQNPTIADNKTTDGNGPGSFASNITGLKVNTTYYIRAYAINSVGIGYGNILSFKTKNTVTDIDGNVYNVVSIGSQVWMLENLKTTHYRNGDAIPNVTDGYTWGNLTSGGYCNYNNEESKGTIYGRLYNGYAASDSRNIAPEGFHVASQAEWLTLINYVGGISIAGGKLKEAGFTHWSSPNTGADNSSGFSALPGGYRHPNDGTGNGKMANLGWTACFWTNDLYTISIQYGSGDLTYRNTTLKPEGFSIRCIKD